MRGISDNKVSRNVINKLCVLTISNVETLGPPCVEEDSFQHKDDQASWCSHDEASRSGTFIAIIYQSMTANEKRSKQRSQKLCQNNRCHKRSCLHNFRDCSRCEKEIHVTESTWYIIYYYNNLTL